MLASGGILTTNQKVGSSNLLRGVPGIPPGQWNQGMASSWYSCIPPCVVFVYPNHRLRKIMNGPNFAETKQS